MTELTTSFCSSILPRSLTYWELKQKIHNNYPWQDFSSAGALKTQTNGIAISPKARPTENE